MQRKPVAVIAMSAALLLFVLLLPPERRLGNSYKFIYIHIPLSVIVFGSVLLYPVIMGAIRKKEFAAVTFAIVTFFFSVIQAAVSVLFMEFAWSGIAFNEPRLLFNMAVIVILAGQVILIFLHPRLALIYSIGIPFMAAWLYWAIMSSYAFQLHPGSLVKMSISFLLPFALSFPLFALLYVMVFEEIRLLLRRLSERTQLLPQRL